MKRLTRRRFALTMTTLVVLSVGVCLWGLSMGTQAIAYADICGALTKICGAYEELSLHETIIVKVRLPRVLLAFFVGMGLSVAGVVLQSLLRNPLAEPHLIGVSSGAALGAVVTALFLSAIPFFSTVTVPVSSFAGALFAVVLLYSLSRRKGVLSVYTLLLVGVILNSFFISIIIFIQSIVSADELMSIFSWLLGSLSFVKQEMLTIVMSVVLGGTLLFCIFAQRFNILSLGEIRAESLGLHVERVKRFSFLMTSLIVGVVVSVSGLIGFVGLVVPHIARMICGPDHRLSIPASACIGGILLVVSDTIARTIIAPQEIPVGVITAFLGGPFFIVLLKRKEMKRVF